MSLAFQMVQEYNSGIVSTDDRPEYLLRLLMIVGAWITSHQPKATALNRQRWQALADLSEAIAAEFDTLDLRTLTSPSNWKDISKQKRSYWLELIDPAHRPGFVLSGKFGEWMQAGATKNVFADYESFWDYIGTPTGKDIKEQKKAAKQALVPVPAPQFVKYYDDVKRDRAKVEFRGRKLHVSEDGSTFSTALCKTVVSGDGWAIFVMAPDAELYAGSHVEGVFHHSTFLSGGAVTAAGEIAVDYGTVKVINSKSGHYRPTRRNMHALVSRLPGIPDDAIILPDFAQKPAPAFTVGDFRRDINCTALVKRDDVIKAIPFPNPTPDWVLQVAP
jgi:hypothetical protein